MVKNRGGENGIILPGGENGISPINLIHYVFVFICINSISLFRDVFNFTWPTLDSFKYKKHNLFHFLITKTIW